MLKVANLKIGALYSFKHKYMDRVMYLVFWKLPKSDASSINPWLKFWDISESCDFFSTYCRIAIFGRSGLNKTLMSLNFKDFLKPGVIYRFDLGGYEQELMVFVGQHKPPYSNRLQKETDRFTIYKFFVIANGVIIEVSDYNIKYVIEV